MRAGSGGGGGNGPLRSHVVYCFAPALDPKASELTFTLTLVERPTYDAERLPIWNEEQIVGGPWELSFSLDTAPQMHDAPVSVVPISGRVAMEDVSVSMMTLECYAWGFIVNSRVDWSGEDGPFPQLTLTALDNTGRSYGTGNCGGGGGAAENQTNTWRMYCKFQPSIASEASELVLCIQSVGLRHSVRSEEEDRFDHWEQTREVTDLGKITVTLPKAG